MLHCLVAMTKPAEKDLREKNKDSVRSARRKHKVIPGGASTKHRTKVNYRNIVPNSYDAGMEPINRPANE